MRVLVTGASGRLGVGDRRASSHADVRRPSARSAGARPHRCRAVRRSVSSEIHPDVIINCAAFNDVDGAQDRVVEALGGERLWRAGACRRPHRASAARLVHYSTDFVFDGEADAPYTEADSPQPAQLRTGSRSCSASGSRSKPCSATSCGSKASSAASRRRGGAASMAILCRSNAGDECRCSSIARCRPATRRTWRGRRGALIERDVAPGLYHCVNSGAGDLGRDRRRSRRGYWVARCASSL